MTHGGAISVTDGVAATGATFGEVEAELTDADAAKRDTAAVWEIYERALRNLKFVRNDGTNGVHNNEYAIAILDTVEADLEEALKQLDSVW
ncbi:MAG: hypothetical protein P8Y04_13405 [Desulfobulbaceae bacterium]